ncbi:MAG TPA: hypothetical protein VHG27_09230 [Xanthobacteraceae bacterium]|nr:hypothetical protein [Xanthobacteraceae bacterium]
MRCFLAPLVLTATLAVGFTETAAAQQVPQFDARPGCRAGAASGAALRADVDGCVRSEQKARDELAAKWHTFAAADRTRCASKTHMGGPPSYIEVLTCLELAQAAREIRKDDNTGLSTGLRR